MAGLIPWYEFILILIDLRIHLLLQWKGREHRITSFCTREKLKRRLWVLWTFLWKHLLEWFVKVQQQQFYACLLCPCLLLLLLWNTTIFDTSGLSCVTLCTYFLFRQDPGSNKPMRHPLFSATSVYLFTLTFSACYFVLPCVLLPLSL